MSLRANEYTRVGTHAFLQERMYVNADSGKLDTVPGADVGAGTGALLSPIESLPRSSSVRSHFLDLDLTNSIDLNVILELI